MSVILCDINVNSSGLRGWRYLESFETFIQRRWGFSCRAEGGVWGAGVGGIAGVRDVFQVYYVLRIESKRSKDEVGERVGVGKIKNFRVIKGLRIYFVGQCF